MHRTLKRTLTTSVAVGLALVAVAPATASAGNPRATRAQATPIAQRLAERAAEGIRSFGIFEIEHMSISCGRPFGSEPRALTCAYALYVRNIEDGTAQMCLNPVYVFKTRSTGRVYGRVGSPSCF